MFGKGQLQFEVTITLIREPLVVENNRELEQAISALTAEILKLASADHGEREALSVTIENAFSRLATAILGQANQSSEIGQPALPQETVEVI